MAGRRDTLVLKRADQVEAVASPIRARLIDDLSVHGPSSVRQIAERVERSPESLYYHVNRLVEAGILIVDGRRRTGRRTEVAYRLVARKLRLDTRNRSKVYTEAQARACAALLRVAERNYRNALRRGDVVREGRLRNLAVRQYNLRLDREGLAEVNAVLDRLTKLKRWQGDAETGDTYAVTLVLSPRSSR